MLVDKGVRVTNAHVNSLPIAEFVMRSVLDEFQEAAQWRDLASERRWRIHDWREVSGSTWVIVGLGGIGTEVARRAQAFGVRVIGCRRHPSPEDPTERTVTPDQLDQVLGLADVVVLAAPATPETDNLVDADFLSRTKPGSLLVNVARGTLIDDNALIASLDSGHLSVAILDVFRTEPLPGGSPVLVTSVHPGHPAQCRRRCRPIPEASRSVQGESRPLPRRPSHAERRHRRDRRMRLDQILLVDETSPRTMRPQTSAERPRQPMCPKSGRDIRLRIAMGRFFTRRCICSPCGDPAPGLVVSFWRRGGSMSPPEAGTH